MVPQSLADYNDQKGEVDNGNQHASTLPLHKKTQRRNSVGMGMVLFERFGLINPALIFHELHPEIKFDQGKLRSKLLGKWTKDRTDSMNELGITKKNDHKCDNILELPQLTQYPHEKIHVDPSNPKKQVRCRICKNRWTSWVCSCCRNEGQVIAFCTTASKKYDQPICWELSKYH